MEDYEVRDVMNRKTHPRIRASIRVHERPVDKRALSYAAQEDVLVKLENFGLVLAHHVMAELELPVKLTGFATEQGIVQREDVEGVACGFLRLTPGPGEAPIFPGSEVILRRRVCTNERIRDSSGKLVTSVRHVKVSVFADEMPPLRAKVDIAPW